MAPHNDRGERVDTYTKRSSTLVQRAKSAAAAAAKYLVKPNCVETPEIDCKQRQLGWVAENDVFLSLTTSEAQQKYLYHLFFASMYSS